MGPKCWGTLLLFFCISIVSTSITAQWIDEDGHEFRRFPGGRLYAGALGAHPVPHYTPRQEARSPQIPPEDAETQFRESEPEHRNLHLKQLRESLLRANQRGRTHRISSELVPELWNLYLSEEVDTMRALEVLLHSKPEDRSQEMVQASYEKIRNARNYYESSMLRQFVIDGMTDEIREDLLENIFVYLEESAFDHDWLKLLESLPPLETYQRLAERLWANDPENSTVRHQILIHLLESKVEEINRDVFERAMRLESAPQPELLAQLISNLRNRSQQEALIQRTRIQLQAYEFLDQTDYLIRLSRHLSLEIRHLMKHFTEDILSLMRSDQISHMHKAHMTEEYLWPLALQEETEAGQRYEILRQHIPLLIHSEALGFKRWNFTQALRNSINSGDASLQSHIYFISTLFHPALEDPEAAPLVDAYILAIPRSWGKALSLDPQILAESLQSSSLRARALAQEILSHMISDESFDRFIEYLFEQNDAALNPLDLILERHRITEQSTQIVLDKMDEERFFGQAGVYFASTRWGGSSEDFILEVLHRSEKHKNERLAHANAVVSFINEFASDSFWKKLELEDLSQVTRLAYRSDEGLSIRSLDSFTDHASSLLVNEDIDIDARIELGKDYFLLIHRNNEIVSDEAWENALQTADYCFDNFFDVTFDEALLFFYRSAAKQYPEKAFEARIDELRESLK